MISSPHSLPIESTWTNLLQAFDEELSHPEIEGIAVGATLTDVLVIELINGAGTWCMSQRWLDRLRWLRRYYRASTRSEEIISVKPGRILVTWRTSTARVDDLIIPVIEAMSPERCTVLYNDAKILPRVPAGADAVPWLRAAYHDRGRWLAAFRRCWPEWRSKLRFLSQRFGLPPGAIERLSETLVANSQTAVASRALLERCRPAAIVTDYDRAHLSSCLVLAGKSLGIPTFSLQHGVPGRDAVGYVPVLADRLFCWGDTHRKIMAAAGQDSANLLIAGCPRLSRDLPPQPATVRARMGLDPARPVVMLGTSPIAPQDRLRIAELFCQGMELLGKATGIVRLHPSESLDFYAELIRRHPSVKFLDNATMTIDEAIAAADVVAVQNSGLGSDALVKRRLTLVIDIPPSPLEHGQELVEEAGCPRATSAEEFAEAADRLLFDAEDRRSRQAAGDAYVKRFCASFGRESARQIASAINEVLSGGGSVRASLRPQSNTKQESTV